MKAWKEAHNEYISLLESKDRAFKKRITENSSSDIYNYLKGRGYTPHYGYGFSFTNPEKSNTYVAVLRLLSEGPMRKGEILNALDEMGAIPHRDIDWTKEPGKRGECSSMFIAMHRAGLIDYDRSTYEWSLNSKGYDYIENHGLNESLLRESKDRLIDKLNLTDEQKTQLKTFFQKHPNYESKINWNNKNLTWEDFTDVLETDGKSRNQAKKSGISGLVEGKDYKLIASGEISYGQTYNIYRPLTYLGSVTLASKRVSPFIEGEWCVASNKRHYWDYYTLDKESVFYYILIDNLDGGDGTKLALDCQPEQVELWDSKDRNVFGLDISNGWRNLADINVLLSGLEQDFAYFDQLAEIMKQCSVIIEKDRAKAMQDNAENAIARYEQSLQAMFTEDGMFNIDNLTTFGKTLMHVMDAYGKYYKNHPPVITVPANYPYDYFPPEELNGENTVFTFKVDDWDTEDVSVFEYVNKIDLSQTKVKTITDRFVSLFDNVKEIEFPSTLETIEDYAFLYSRELQVADLSKTKLVKIGDKAFDSCWALGSIMLPSTVRGFGFNFIGRCKNLEDISINMPKETFMNLFPYASFETSLNGQTCAPKAFHTILNTRKDFVMYFSDKKCMFTDLVLEWTQKFNKLLVKDQLSEKPEEEILF